MHRFETKLLISQSSPPFNIDQFFFQQSAIIWINSNNNQLLSVWAIAMWHFYSLKYLCCFAIEKADIDFKFILHFSLWIHTEKNCKHCCKTARFIPCMFTSTVFFMTLYISIFKDLFEKFDLHKIIQLNTIEKLTESINSMKSPMWFPINAKKNTKLN